MLPEKGVPSAVVGTVWPDGRETIGLRPFPFLPLPTAMRLR